MLAHQKPGRARLFGGAAVIAALTAGAGLAAWSAEPSNVRITPSPVRQSVAPTPQAAAPTSARAAAELAAAGYAPVTLVDKQAKAEPAPAEPKPIILAQAPAAPPAAAPGDLDRYVGAYQITRYGSMMVTRQGDSLVLGPQPGPPPEQYLRGSDGVWTGTTSGQQVTFHQGPDGRVSDLSFSGGPTPGTMRRLPDGEAEKRAAELAAKLKAQTPDPRTEGVIREMVRSVVDGSVNFDRVFGERAAVQYRAQFADMQADFKSLGDLKSLAFKAVGPQGGDQYVVTFANGVREIRVILDQQGRIDTMGVQLR
jgi:hypothetical protein